MPSHLAYVSIVSLLLVEHGSHTRPRTWVGQSRFANVIHLLADYRQDYAAAIGITSPKGA